MNSNTVSLVDKLAELEKEADPSWLDQITSFLNFLNNLPPEILTILALIILGYMIKVSDVISNKIIPLIIVVIGCPVYIFSELIGGKKFFLGIILSWVAWMIHNKGLRHIENHIPFLKDLLSDESEKVPEKKKEPRKK